jgi:ADP-heptose:LPS heptosyltransferase
VTTVAVRGALAVHPGALGDVLLAIPALRALRARHGAVTLATRAHLAELVATLGEADAVRDFESLRLDALFSGDGAAELPEVEHVVSWFGARDPEFVRRLKAQAPSAVVAPSVASGVVWEHLVRTCGGAVGEIRMPAQVTEASAAAGRALLVHAGWDGRRRVVLVHPGAGGAAKRWPVEGFAAALAGLAARNELALVLHEGPADRDAVAGLAVRLPDALRLREPALPALAGALRHAAVYVGNDSGVSHLAATVGAPTVVLFTAAYRAWVPWAREPEIIDVAVSDADARDVTKVRDAIERRLA